MRGDSIPECCRPEGASIGGAGSEPQTNEEKASGGRGRRSKMSFIRTRRPRKVERTRPPEAKQILPNGGMQVSHPKRGSSYIKARPSLLPAQGFKAWEEEVARHLGLDKNV